jgi:2-polyprenyl-3-methyl-5-hydroxy-6-metoxy-1,4-benzoquinol methylase
VVTTYDNQFYHDNVYGHALALLETVCKPDDSVHLDVGCGFGRIAEPLVGALRRNYVGIDADRDGLSSLSARGFETHQFMLQDADTNLAFFRKVLDGRRLGSITIIDTLEHLFDPHGTIAALRTLAAETAAPIVVSVPNIAHLDVAAKLMIGRFDYTEDGLLDHTHVRFFTEDGLLRMMAGAGWHAVAAKGDVYYRNSDQHFPAANIALAEGSSLNQFLRSLRERADPNAYVNQLVRLFMCGPEIATDRFVQPTEIGDAPFLTVVVRTDGTRPEHLRELLLALSGQSSTDFEIVVVGSKLSSRRILKLERVIEDNVAWLRGKIRLIRIEIANGAASANAGVAEARGTYVAFLDDFSLLFSHWVETFSALNKLAPGTILRTGCVTQTSSEYNTRSGDISSFAVSGFQRSGSVSFDIFDNLETNTTPGLALAFPRSAFVDLAYRFDESLNSNELWDMLIDIGGLCGVTNSAEITSVDRHWTSPRTSIKPLSDERRLADERKIQLKYELTPLVLPAGGSKLLRKAALEERLYPGIGREREELRFDNANLNGSLNESKNYAKDLEAELNALRNYAQALEHQAQLREIALGEARERIAIQDSEAHNLRNQIEGLYAEISKLNDSLRTLLTSKSWRVMSPARRMLWLARNLTNRV